MPRYVVFLRRVSSMNLKMPQLKACLAESGGAVERKAEAARQARLGRTFYTVARRVDALRELIDTDPFEQFKLPFEVEEARIPAVHGREILTAYVPQPGNPVFMVLEETFGRDVTTRRRRDGADRALRQVPDEDLIFTSRRDRAFA